MNFFRKNPPLNQRSQIAVIITFVIAVILLFIAVFINLAKVSQVKTATSTATDRTALSLASQLGSMSYYYKDKVLKGGTEKTIAGKKVIEKCGPGWIVLGLVVLATAVIAFFLTPLTLIGAATTLLSGATLTAYLSTSMLGGIDNKFNEMTLYNSLRERALFQALISTQSDDVEFKAKTTGTGIFYDDINGNGVFDAGTDETYDLSAIPEMHNEKKVSRFLAWYYKKRLLLVSEDGLKTALNTFLNGTPLFPGLKSFTDTDEWSGTEWKIKKLSYILKQLPTLGGSSNYEITCNMAAPDKCPDWVKDKATEQLRIVRIDSSNDAYGGFLDSSSSPPLHTLKNLLTRLNSQLSGTFSIDDVDNLIKDLRRFLAGCKDVFNLPVSERLRNITQWFPIFYDSKAHKPDDKSSLDGDLEDDIYERLTRDQNYINTWITELETLNSNKIAGPMPTPNPPTPGTIPAPNGHNQYGLGSTVSNCPTKTCCGYCGENPCCPPCCNPAPCSFKGIYCSAYEDSTPPACEYGDLYGTIPSWCYQPGSETPGLENRSANCKCSCSPSRSPQKLPACEFQGQLALTNTSGQTEVEQAARILRALKDDLARIQRIIGDLANAIVKQLPPQPYEPYIDSNGNGAYDDGETFEDWDGDTKYTADLPDYYKRNKIVYAWKDKSQFSHLVSAAIDKYPKQLPHVTENSVWDKITETCQILEDYAGDFTITTSRYDQDQPTDIAGWKLRRRRKGPLPEGREFYVSRLNEIVSDIQDNAQIDYPLNKEGIEDLLTYFNYAISSSATAHYGPEKSDIKITETEGD